MLGLSLVAASGGHSSSRCAGLSLSQPLLLRNTGSRRAGSVIVAHGPSCSVACGIFPDQGSTPCPLHWQADSQPLRHQGSPYGSFKGSVLTKCSVGNVSDILALGLISWDLSIYEILDSDLRLGMMSIGMMNKCQVWAPSDFESRVKESRGRCILYCLLEDVKRQDVV